jgi:DNA-binding MarR family transcriptional regulator
VKTEDEVRANFGRIWPAHVGSLTRFLIECRAALDGDLDMFLVLAVIGDRTFSQRKVDPAMTFAEFQASTTQTAPEDINVRSIAEFSGIPRETVRRKVAELVERGWVAKKDDGFLVATAQAKAELEPLTNASVKYIAGMMKLLRDT